MAREFQLRDGVALLNHASYGVATSRSLQLGARIRADLEADPTKQLGARLQERLRSITTATARWLGLDSGELALTTNATSAAAAVIASLPLSRNSTVVVLSTEYSSIARAWEIRCGRVEARYQVVDVPLPLAGADDVVARLDAEVPGAIDVLQVSAISSSAALQLPTAELGRWVRARGGALIIDAAHGPGHVALAPLANDGAVIFGTLHKWLPAPRSAGFLWVAGEFAESVRPAEVSLTWDAPGLTDRFGWPGTFDPTPRLCIEDAIEQWELWQRAGLFDRAARLADHATARLEAEGAVCTAAVSLRPPRLQTVLLPDVALERLRSAVDSEAVRVWTGADASGTTLLRLSTHVYNDEADVDRVVRAVRTATVHAPGSSR